MIDTKGSYLVDDYLEVADFWAWETDENLVLTYLSSGFTALTGLPVDEFLGRSRSQINKRDLDHDIWRKHHETLMRRQPFRRFRYPLEASSGEIRWFESSGIPHFDAEGRFVGYRGVARDVTEHANGLQSSTGAQKSCAAFLRYVIPDNRSLVRNPARRWQRSGHWIPGSALRPRNDGPVGDSARHGRHPVRGSRAQPVDSHPALRRRTAASRSNR